MAENIRFITYGRRTRRSEDWTPSLLPGLSKLYYIYSGSVWFNGKELEPGHLYIFPDCRGDWKLVGELDHLYFDFFITPPLIPREVIDIKVDEHPGIKAVCEAASTVFRTIPVREAKEDAGLLLELLLSLCDRVKRLRSTGDERIDRAIGYICLENLSDGAEIAARVHLDRFYFLKLFGRLTGMPPGKYARSVRMTRAAAMLGDGVQISGIAQEAGFASDTAFVAAFRKHFGMTPGKMRKKIQEEKKMHIVRRGKESDTEQIAAIYERIQDNEERVKALTGWKKGIYPTIEDARDMLEKNELFVMEAEGRVVASARINKAQVDVYSKVKWEYDAPDDKVMVLHTLAVDPLEKGRGYGTAFVGFYEKYALENGCHFLRMDTNAINIPARGLYKKLGYKEVGIVHCDFNGINGIDLVCLEKKI